MWFKNLSVPVADLHDTTMWVHYTVPDNPCVLLDDLFLFNLLSSPGQSVWHSDITLWKDIYNSLQIWLKVQLPMSFQLSLPVLPVMLLPQSWKYLVKFVIRSLTLIIPFFFHACNDSYSVRSSCFTYFHLYNLTSVIKTEGFSLPFVLL